MFTFARGYSQGQFLFYNGTAPTRIGTVDGPLAGPGFWAQMLAGATASDLVLVGSFDHYVYALKASDGSLVWKHDTLGAITSDVIVDRGLALVGNRAYDLAAYDAATGRPVWRRYVWFSWVESIPTVRDGVAFVGSSDALKFFAVDGATGAPVWTAPMPGWSWSRPVVTDRYACLGAVGIAAESDGHDGGYLCLNRRTGNPRFTLKGSVAEGTGEWGFASSGVWIAGTFYAADLSGTVWAFSDGAETTKGRGSRPRPHDSQTPRD